MHLVHYYRQLADDFTGIFLAHFRFHIDHVGVQITAGGKGHDTNGLFGAVKKKLSVDTVVGQVLEVTGGEQKVYTNFPMRDSCCAGFSSVAGVNNVYHCKHTAAELKSNFVSVVKLFQRVGR